LLIQTLGPNTIKRGQIRIEQYTMSSKHKNSFSNALMACISVSWL